MLQIYNHQKLLLYNYIQQQILLGKGSSKKQISLPICLFSNQLCCLYLYVKLFCNKFCCFFTFLATNFFSYLLSLLMNFVNYL